MSASHTPFPWHAAGRNVIGGDPGQTVYVARTLDGPYAAPPDEERANMALILAIPRMVAALRGIIDAYPIDKADTARGKAWLAAYAALEAAGVKP